ncbi:GAF and ANTAR domain-containing protein [Jatrophihabitans fulvus]
MTDFDPQTGRAVPSDGALSGEQRRADERDVAGALDGLAGLVAGADDLDAVLQHIAEFAWDATPNADGAGVTITGPATAGQVLAWAATAPFVREIDRLQYDVCVEGPCLTAMATRRSLVSGSLGSDDRWPRFGGRVARLAVHSALAVPLVVRDDVVGSLNIYARERDAFSEHAVRLAERFAVPAAVSVENVRRLHEARHRADHLQAALTSRAVVDQAIGILRSRSGCSAEAAFDRLRRSSQSEDVKLSTVAQRLVDEAVRRARARGTAGDV